MKIIKLEAENVKRLKAVEINPDGPVQVITGKNGAGKSSVLDAIYLALAGRPAAKETILPIRDGETKASVRLDLGDLVVLRTWTASGTTLKVTNAGDGSEKKSPQGLLDSMLGQLSFDPLAFTLLSPKAQLEALLALVELPFNPAELDAERAAIYDQRTEVNRKVRELKVQLEDAPPAPRGTPDNEVSASAIVDQINAAAANNARHSAARSRVFDLRRQIDDLEAKLAELRDAEQAAIAICDACDQPVDIAPLQAQLENVEQTNRQVRDKQRRSDIQSALSDAETAATDLTGKLAEIDKRKADGLAAATFPVEGLGFDEAGVTFDGVPFSQASAAQQIRVSLAMAMSGNPELRVARIKDGSLLDEDSMQLIAEMAAAHDFQVWIERVGSSADGTAVLIEDGEVVS